MYVLTVAYGKDIVKITRGALAASDIGAYLKQGMAVALKPNLVVARPANEGATTHPEVVEGVIQFLKEFGITDITVIESAWIGDSTKRAFKVCGYEDLSKKYGVPLIDLKSDSAATLSHGGLSMDICNAALKTDFLINIPVLKAHCQTRLTCNLKNLKGCIPDHEKRRFHSIGLHKPIAVLNALLKTGYCVVDGVCGDLSFEEGGNPVEANRVIAGRNPVLVDSYGAGLIGYHPDQIEHLSYAKQLGLGAYFGPDTAVKEINADAKPVRKPGGRLADKHRGHIVEDAACSACYSALVHALHRCSGTPRVQFYIGQGFQGKAGGSSEGGAGISGAAAIGVGDCARGFADFVPGCPPSAAAIIEKIRR
jgi:uncharacterized protein (DUF362 family)